MKFKRFGLRMVWLGLFGAMATGAQAQAPTQEWLIGASLPLSGFNAAAGKEGLLVAQSYFDALNKAGGVAGRRITLRVLDDQFQPKKAAENAEQLAKDGVLALFNCWGTASCSAMMPVINSYKLPLVTGIAGGGPMRLQPGRYAFNMRPSTEDEMSYMLKQMAVMGQKRIAVVYQNDPFGKSGLAAAQAVLGRSGQTAALEQSINADASDAAAVVDAMVKTAPNSVMLVASPLATVKLITQLRQAGQNMQVYSLAAQANHKVLTDLGSHTTGAVFTTLVPSPWRTNVAVVKEYQQLMHDAGLSPNDYSYLGLEVFLNAKVLVEGLRRMGRGADREALITSLETMEELHFGASMSVKYGPGDRSGSRYVGLTTISREGRFIE